MLVIFDEYSRFPFVHACKDMKTSTVIKKLTDLFCVFGFSCYIHLTKAVISCLMNLNCGYTVRAFLPVEPLDIIHGVTGK